MKSFVEEFKGFAMRGNVFDLAIAVIIGTAFGKIVSSLADNVIMPLIGVILGGVNFSAYAFTLGNASIAYGKFVQSVIDFLIIALVIFIAMKMMNKVHAKPKEATKPSEPSEEVLLLREIRDSVKR